MMNTEHRGNILFLTHRFPYPPDKGDRIRTFHLLKWLSRRASVYLATLADEPFAARSVEVLEDLCEAVAIHELAPRTQWIRSAGSLILGRTATAGAFWSPSFARTIEDWAKAVPFDFVIASSSGLAPYLRKGAARNIPALVDLVDVDSQKWLDYAQSCRGPRRWLYNLEGTRLRRVERAVPTWARATILVSRAECDVFREFCDTDRLHAVENGVDLDTLAPRGGLVEEPGSCTFVGALDYRPNIDAVHWFCREVWPTLHHLRPDARMSVVGRRPVAAVQKLASIPGVEVVGQVPDVRPYLEKASVVVVPLRIARGIQNKVLEAMAMGKAVVASPQALKGFRPGLSLPVRSASTAGEWVENLIGLFDDAEERKRLGEAGRAFVSTHHHWDRCLHPLAEILGVSADPLDNQSTRLPEAVVGAEPR